MLIRVTSSLMTTLAVIIVLAIVICSSVLFLRSHQQKTKQGHLYDLPSNFALSNPPPVLGAPRKQVLKMQDSEYYASIDDVSTIIFMYHVL